MTPGIKRSRFIKRSRPRRDPEARFFFVPKSEFVVIIVVIILHGERERERIARRCAGKTDRYPKCRLAGLRAGMQCEPAITATRCHPEEGNFVSKVHYAPRRRRGAEKRAAFLLFDDHTCGLLCPPRRLRSRPRRKIISYHFRHRPIYNRAQSIRTKSVFGRNMPCFRNASVESDLLLIKKKKKIRRKKLRDYFNP